MSYSREQVKAITDKILNMCKADAVEVEFPGGERSATRYANSTITANLVEHDQEVDDHRLLRPEVGVDDDAPVRRCVAEARRSSRCRRWRSASRTTRRRCRWSSRRRITSQVEAALPSAVNFGPAERAQMVKKSVEICEKNGVRRRRLHPEDALDPGDGELRRACSPTTATPTPASSSPAARPTAPARAGPARPNVKDVSQIDAAAITEIAADKALKSQKPRAIEPGNYTVILEPRPAARFLSLMLQAFNARAGGRRPQLHERQGARHDEARQKVFGDNVTIRSDIEQHRSCGRRRSAPTASPRSDVTWIEKGVVKNLLYDRFWAQKQGKTPTAATPQMSLVMDGGDQTLEQMIKSTQARPAGHRSSGTSAPSTPMTLLNTGMTRDGLFLIENGEIVGAGAELPLERRRRRAASTTSRRSAKRRADAHRRSLRPAGHGAGAGDADRRLHDDVDLAGGVVWLRATGFRLLGPAKNDTDTEGLKPHMA